MRFGKIASGMVIALVSAGPAAAQSCTTDAAGLRISCGMLSGNKVGNTTYWSDGTTTTHVGSMSVHSDGSSNALKSNAPLMGPGSFNDYGVTTGNGSRSCSLVGDTSFCN